MLRNVHNCMRPSQLTAAFFLNPLHDNDGNMTQTCRIAGWEQYGLKAQINNTKASCTWTAWDLIRRSKCLNAFVCALISKQGWDIATQQTSVRWFSAKVARSHSHTLDVPLGVGLQIDLLDAVELNTEQTRLLAWLFDCGGLCSVGGGLQSVGEDPPRQQQQKGKTKTARCHRTA